MSICLQNPSAQVPCKCHLNDLRVLLESPLNAQFPFQRSMSTKNLQHGKKWTGQKFCRVFKNFTEYIFYITLIFFAFLGNKMCNFHHFLLARCDYSKWFQKLLLNIL